MYVIVVGGGKVGYYLTKQLLTEGHEVLLLEKDRRRQAMLAEQLGEVVVQGDGCEVRIMSEAGFGRADVIVAVTGDDEDNLVIISVVRAEHAMIPGADTLFEADDTVIAMVVADEEPQLRHIFAEPH